MDAACLTFKIGQTVWLIETESKAVVLNLYRVNKINRVIVRTENNTLMHMNESKASHAIPSPNPNVCRNAEKVSKHTCVRKQVRGRSSDGRNVSPGVETMPTGGSIVDGRNQTAVGTGKRRKRQRGSQKI